jgi:hypothetical protein
MIHAKKGIISSEKEESKRKSKAEDADSINEELDREEHRRR